ncbi:MAG: DUF1937 family protein [Alphaproteobacteria bacterium]
MPEIIYLACPYTDPDPSVREARFRKAALAAAHLIERKKIVYSPITMTHPLDIILAKESETLGSDFWVKFDEAFMEFCSKIIVLRIEGWELSSGVKREIDYFRSKKRSVEYLDWDEVVNSKV